MSKPKWQCIVKRLRQDADALATAKGEVLFVKNDCPFVDMACEAIENGGTVDATSLASLIHYIADMME